MNDLDLINKKIGFLGFGFMAQNICKGFLSKELLPPSKIFFYDINQNQMDQTLKKNFPNVKSLSSNQDVVKNSDVIILAVKPQVALPLLQETEKYFTGDKLLISICAGISVKQLEEATGQKTKIIRTMPNISVSIGYGMTVYCWNPRVTEEDKKLIRKLLESVGACMEVEEKEINIATGISGSGPAYVFMGLDAAGDGGCQLGMSRQKSQILAAHTLIGAAKMFLETQNHPGVLKDSVCSPAGTTMAGVEFLEKEKFRYIVAGAIKAGHERALQLEKIAEQKKN